MRVSNEITKFISSIPGSFVPGAEVYLFGSRTNDKAKGGDIDVLILSDKKLEFKKLSNIRTEFYKRFGYQKLDLVNFTFTDTDPFKSLAMTDAIKL
jgi:predicted nucleotidyltransferase